MAPRIGPPGPRLRSYIPDGVHEVEIPRPSEVSGVAAIPGGYAVVGDEDQTHGWIWPGGFQFPLPDRVSGPESIDVGIGPDGEQLWLVLCEKGNLIVDLQGGETKLKGKEIPKETAGRGFEGIAVRHVDGGWQVAALWEGGYFNKGPRAGECENPRIVLLDWKAGEGGGKPTVIELKVPHPNEQERFRAPDLVWLGDEFLVLLGSTDSSREVRSHTWLQRFDLKGRAKGTPMRLEKEWGSYRAGKNWEALDWTLDGRWLVMGHDAKIGGQALAVFRYPPG